MEDKNNIQFNNAAEDLPEIKRKEDGSIDLEATSTGKDDKGNYIFPDNVIESYYKELPNGSTNESRNKWVYNSGILIKANKEVQTAGGKALQAKLEQRRTFADVISTMLAQKASKEASEGLDLRPGADNLEAIIAAAAKQASRGNVKAMEFLRDTIGEKPTEKIDASVTGLTAEDKEMIRNMESRLAEKDKP